MINVDCGNPDCVEAAKPDRKFCSRRCASIVTATRQWAKNPQSGNSKKSGKVKPEKDQEPSAKRRCLSPCDSFLYGGCRGPAV